MSDKISILAHPRNLMVKSYDADGTVKPYGGGKYFSLRTPEVHNIHELSEVLTALELAQHAFIIRGRYAGDARAAELDATSQAGKVLRRLDIFEDQPLHTLMIEVDRYRPLAAHPFMEPLAAAHEYISAVLPTEFHEKSFHWQLSNSAGRDPNLLKIHMWFWLETPATSDQLRQWAGDINLDSDHTVYNPVQIHYTGNPAFTGGAEDPVPVRSGFYTGLLGDEVPLNLSHIVNSERKVKQRGLMSSAANRDATAKFLHDHGLVLSVGKDAQLHITCPFEAKHGSARKGDDETSYFLQGTGGFDRGTFTCFHDSCRRREDYHSDVVAALDVYQDDFDVVVPKLNDVVTLPRMARNKNGLRVPSLANLAIVFARPDYFGFHVCFDSFLNNTMIAPFGTDQWRAFNDTDLVKLRRRLETAFGFAPIPHEMMRHATMDAASEHEFDSAALWLKSHVWDGQARVEGFFTRYFGVLDSEYTRAVSRYTWSALAGRVLHPGIKADMVPILVGKQGMMKSSGVKAMCPHEEFFSEIDLNKRDEDQSRIMRGKLIGEIAELKGLHSRDAESIKSFITRTHEEWIPKYREMSTVFPRRIIFIGTTNDSQFLSDPTGNRRWLPMEVSLIDVDAIARDMRQLWAEARHLYLNGGVDWSAENLAADAHATYRRVDPWEEIINDWLDTPDDMTGETPRATNKLQISVIARDALNLDVRNYNPQHGTRIGNFLRVEGYCERREVLSTGKKLRVWGK